MLSNQELNGLIHGRNSPRYLFFLNGINTNIVLLLTKFKKFTKAVSGMDTGMDLGSIPAGCTIQNPISEPNQYWY